MIFLALALWCSVAAFAADPRLAVVQQRQVVDTLATEVATARAGAADRDELADLMARYREAAERLAALEAPELAAAAGAEAGERSAARRGLAEALARGTADDRDRGVLVGWLGEPEPRVAALAQALDAVSSTRDDAVRRGLAVDVADQADVLSLISAYDTARAERDRERAATQAAALRARTAPGQTGGMDLVVAAERLEREAQAAEKRATSARELRTRADELRAAALALSVETP
ncbi:MAG: hypothetical protein ABMB14_05080 [Myxococcota bacterium]